MSYFTQMKIPKLFHPYRQTITMMNYLVHYLITDDEENIYPMSLVDFYGLEYTPERLLITVKGTMPMMAGKAYENIRKRNQ
jgi:hypothetical protein